VGEAAGLVDGGNDDVAEREESGDGRNDEEGDLPQAFVEAGAHDAGDFFGGAERATHHGQFGGGDGHAEQADGQGVEGLRVGQSGDGAGGEPTGEEGVDVSADLHDAATDEDGKEIADDGADMFGLMREGEF
jgi:hypothetical protein